MEHRSKLFSKTLPELAQYLHDKIYNSDCCHPKILKVLFICWVIGCYHRQVGRIDNQCHNHLPLLSGHINRLDL